MAAMDRKPSQKTAMTAVTKEEKRPLVFPETWLWKNRFCCLNYEKGQNEKHISLNLKTTIKTTTKTREMHLTLLKGKMACKVFKTY